MKLSFIVQMNLGEGPQFIAIEVDLAAVIKLKSNLVSKFHLSHNFFKLSGSDPSQRYIIFRLAGPITAEDVANINEVSDFIAMYNYIAKFVGSLTV